MDYQNLVFRWAALQAAATGAAIFALGLLSAFLGFRFARFLLAVSTAGVAGVAGWNLAEALELPTALPALVLAAGALAAALRYQRVGVVTSAGATFAALGYYLATQTGLHLSARWACALVAGGFGVTLAWLNKRSMPLVVTTVQGAVLMVVGFVGLSNALLPSLGVTFRQWSAESALLVPVLLSMLCVTAYSYQANMQQGDIRTGA
jgi:hypothetical protein